VLAQVWNVLTMACDCGPGLGSAAVKAAGDAVLRSEAAVERDLAVLVERMRSAQERALEELYDAAALSSRDEVHIVRRNDSWR
jgi:hypothetical protein